jgi:hypothetical protein
LVLRFHRTKWASDDKVIRAANQPNSTQTPRVRSALTVSISTIRFRSGGDSFVTAKAMTEPL